jgi:hypothetical protein
MSFRAIIIVVFSLAFLLESCGGSKDACEKAKEVVKDWCVQYEAENCLPCVCVFREQDWNVIIEQTPLGPMLDIERSGCVELRTCEGQALEDAKACLEEERVCDPCIHPVLEVNWCNDPAFPSFCDPIW